MKKAVLIIFAIIASLEICSSVYSQELTGNQKEKIASEIAADFEKNIKAAESFDAKGLTDCVNDTLKAGFIENGIFSHSFDEVMKRYKEGIKGVKSLKYSISNKKITACLHNSRIRPFLIVNQHIEYFAKWLTINAICVLVE